MLKLIKEYFELKIYSKKALIKEINRIDKCIQQLYSITAGQERMFEEYSKTSYKEKWKNEHNKVKELEKIIKEREV